MALEEGDLGVTEGPLPRGPVDAAPAPRHGLGAALARARDSALPRVLDKIIPSHSGFKPFHDEEEENSSSIPFRDNNNSLHTVVVDGDRSVIVDAPVETSLPSTSLSQLPTTATTTTASSIVVDPHSVPTLNVPSTQSDSPSIISPAVLSVPTAELISVSLSFAFSFPLVSHLILSSLSSSFHLSHELTTITRPTFSFT